MLKSMSLLLAMVALAPLARTEVATNEPPVRLAVELTDGSRLVGTSDIASIPAQTAYAKLEIELKHVRSITLEPDRELAVFAMRNGDRVKGALLLKTLELRSAFGKIAIGAEQIAKISVSSIETTVMHKANAQNMWRYSYKWGSDGSGDGQFNMPHGVAVAPDGRVFVADTANLRIQVFEADGTFVRKWGCLGSGDGQFKSPYAIAVAPDGQVLVSEGQLMEGYNHRIQVFEADGTFVRKWGSFGTGDGQFNWPYGLAAAPNGQVFVADRYNHRIQVFESDGTFVRKWGSAGSGEGQFNAPTGVAVAPDGQVYVGDYDNHRIQVFESDGTFVRKWGGAGSGDGQFTEPTGLVVTPDRQVVVVDQSNSRLQVFEADGTFVGKWGSAGSGDGQFDIPVGIAVAPDGRIFVPDARNHPRIQVFAMP